MKSPPIDPENPNEPPRLYGDIRSRIRTGDILLFRGTSWISRFIRSGSRSVYSHAGMMAWWDDRLVVFQATTARGIELLPVSSVVDHYPGQIDWWTVLPEYQSALDRRLLQQEAITDLGKPYAKVGLIEVVARMLVGRFRGLPDPLADPEAMFCSQYVSHCYRCAGLDLRPDTSDDCTSPGDFATSGRLAFQAVIRPHPSAG